MDPFDQLIEQNDRMRASAVHARDAAEDFARAANGRNGRIILVPTAYDLIGSTKVLLWNVAEVTRYLPHGLYAGMTDDAPRIRLGNAESMGRNAAAYVKIAQGHVEAITAALAVGADQAEQAEQAQTVLNDPDLSRYR